MSELLHQLSLTLVPQIGCVHAKILIDYFGEASTIFKAKKTELGRIEGIGQVRAAAVKAFTDFARAEAEMAFIEKNEITPLFINEPGYPKRLLHCYDSPTMLYCKGTPDLNAAKIVAIVGTRTCSDYGKQVTEQLVAGLAEQGIMILSGLAYGIDAAAHKAALKNELSTVGVLAHGLDILYPPQHKNLAKEMVQGNGGLLSEFMSGTEPDRHNFPTRNRVVAGMADATVVIETDVKGGSMITANLAHGYNRDVFAFPGRATDAKSAGCNRLIKNNKAALITEAADLIQMMRWEPVADRKPAKRQRELFIELTEEERKIVAALQTEEAMHIDAVYMHTGLSSSAVAGAMLSLELQNLVQVLPGKLYKLL
jgi:DNA processing protein